MNPIDLRSDTVTAPGKAIYNAIQKATTKDAYHQEDINTKELASIYKVSFI